MENFKRSWKRSWKVMEFEEIKRVYILYWYFSITQSSFGPKDTNLLCV